MRAVGIIAEYNPFHNGHAFHIQEARRKSQAEVAIICMSGNFVQRGEPALVSKWQRAGDALDHGADLVVEMPLTYALQAGDIFARSGVAILSSMGCSGLSFGVESGGARDYERAGRLLAELDEKIAEEFSKEKMTNTSYARQISDVTAPLLKKENIKLDPGQSNALLGMLYARENAKRNLPMELFPILRKKAQHTEKEIKKAEQMASGTAIRNALLSQDEELRQTVQYVVPEQAYSRLIQGPYVDWEKAWPYLKYQLMVQDASQLREIYQMTEGLENRLKKYITVSSGFQDFMEKIKTKRYTWTRLQRLLCYSLLQLGDEEVTKSLAAAPQHVRLLGFTSRGREYLNQLNKEEMKMEIISNVKQASQDFFKSDIKAGDIYRLLADEQIPSQDFLRMPVIKK